MAEVGSSYMFNDSGRIAYYWSNTCHDANSKYGIDTYTAADGSGCAGHNDFAGSKIKEALDNYMNDYLDSLKLKEIAGYKIRLITVDELRDNLGWNDLTKPATDEINSGVPSWVYSNYHGWTMSADTDGKSVFLIGGDGKMYSIRVWDGGSWYSGARPVINLYKSAISNN